MHKCSSVYIVKQLPDGARGATFASAAAAGGTIASAAAAGAAFASSKRDNELSFTPYI
jgi:hypothetical protein